MFKRLIECFFIAFSCYQRTSSQPGICHQNEKSLLKEGNLGQTKAFPWLGVLRVHFHEDDKFKIALTGLVLIKLAYGITNADDVVKIPKNVLRRESKAMFIMKDNETWSCRVKDYTIHPEYEFATYNTIALIELDFEDYNDELLPICWPGYNYNTRNELYALGYVDDNMILEKVIYKIQYVKLDMCKEFYNRIGFKKDFSTPTSYYCGYAINNKENCAWDNGMVLASNSTGPWVLIGFGIKGPGCAAPSRFIEMASYLPWIQSLTDQIYS